MDLTPLVFPAPEFTEIPSSYFNNVIWIPFFSQDQSGRIKTVPDKTAALQQSSKKIHKTDPAFDSGINNHPTSQNFMDKIVIKPVKKSNSRVGVQPKRTLTNH